MPKNAFYAQSGGVTAVINATAAGVIETARSHPDRIGKVLAGRNGIIGALTEDLIDTSRESAESIAALKHTPSGAFGSCRYKLKGLDESRAEYERLIDVFRAHDIGYFFYNGGGDSSDTAFKVSQLGETLGYPVVAVGIPKTVDNDLPITDNCPGFGSVAKYVAVSIREASFDVASMALTSTKVFILEVMGRHAGWIAAAGGLAADRAGDPPQVILFPEIAFDEDAFIEKVRTSVEKDGFCSVVVSEGVRNREGRFLSEAGASDAFGHAQLGGVAPVIANLVKQRLGFKYHWAVADYLQRAARHIASQTDLEQAYALGKAAVEIALAGRNGVMPVLVRTSDEPYAWEVGEASPVRGCERREEGSARLRHRGRIRDHRSLPEIPGAAHPGRGVPPISRRPPGLRRPRKRLGSEEAGHGVRVEIVPVPGRHRTFPFGAGRCRGRLAQTRRSGAGRDASGQKRRDHQAHDGHHVDQDVHRGTRRVLERIAHGVAHHHRVMRLRALASVVSLLDVFLGVVPRTSGIGHGQREEHAAEQRATQQPAQRLGADAESDHPRRGRPR